MNSNGGSGSLDSEGFIRRAGDLTISRELFANIIENVNGRNKHGVACLKSLRKRALHDLRGVQLHN